MEDLRALGVGYVETGDESGGGGTEKASRRSSLTRPSEAPGFNMPILTPLDAPFPKTHSKSALGISLSEEDLRDRCLGLDTWMRSVAENYFLFDVEAKVSATMSTIIYSPCVKGFTNCFYYSSRNDSIPSWVTPRISLTKFCI
jgi:hypothetical protein